MRYVKTTAHHVMRGRFAIRPRRVSDALVARCPRRVSTANDVIVIVVWCVHEIHSW